MQLPLPVPMITAKWYGRKEPKVLLRYCFVSTARHSASDASPTRKNAGLSLRILSENPSEVGQDAQRPRLGRRLCPAVDRQLAIDAAGVTLDRAERDEQSPGNFTV